MITQLEGTLQNFDSLKMSKIVALTLVPGEVRGEQPNILVGAVGSM